MASEHRKKFEAAVAADKWLDAYKNFHPLSMSEMLQSLAGLSKSKFDLFMKKRFDVPAKDCNWPRFEYAWTVVKDKKLPLIAPGDLLKTKQVETAASFLKTTAPSAPSLRLKVKILTSNVVTNRTLTGELKKKTEEILADQGNGFKLDAEVYAKDIANGEVVYLISQLEDMVSLAEKETTIPTDRVIVLMVRAQASLNIHGLAMKVKGATCCVIDTDTPNPDRATLLHEIGHCAGLPHSGERQKETRDYTDFGDNLNVMALAKTDVKRSVLTVTQGKWLAKAAFASK